MNDRQQGVKEHQIKVIDKRRVGKDKNVASIEPNLKPSYVEQLENKVTRMESALKNKIAELEEESIRSRQRVEKDLEKRFEEKFEKLISEVLELSSAIEKAIELSSEDEKVKEGLELISKGYLKFLEKLGVEVLNPINEEFDPNVMEAIQTQKGEKNRVLSVYQKGYKKGDKILKAPKVVVGSGEEE